MTLEEDGNLINKILEDVDMRYIILFQYIIRNDLFRDLMEEEIIENYERVLILDDIYKSNVMTLWEEDFIEVAVDLGLFKNIRSLREFEQKDPDFILKMGEETITIESNTILVPDDTLFLMISKKFKDINRRNFNLALSKLRGIRCESTGIIHPFIYLMGENDYTLADDLYSILDQYGNLYQAIKIELTIEGFHQRFQEILDEVSDFIEIFDPALKKEGTIKKIKQAIEEDKDIIKFLKDEKIKLSDKFETDEVDKNAEIYKNWNDSLINLIKVQDRLDDINSKLKEIKKYYSGKDKVFSYLKFIEKISFNEDDLVNEIQNSLIKLREEIIEIKDETSNYSKKQLKLLNLDFERFLILNGEE